MRATKEDVMRFARAVWPTAPDLALASFDEKKALNDAADRIAELERENTAISHLLTAQGLHIKELEKALLGIRAFLVKVNEGIEMGNIDSQIVADIDLVLMVSVPK